MTGGSSNVIYLELLHACVENGKHVAGIDNKYAKAR
jgi:hypothetical protein